MGIVPSRLYRVKLFESKESFTRKDDGWLRDEESDDILEVQINAWVSQEKVLVVGTGPISVSVSPIAVHHPAPHDTVRIESRKEETRTVAIIYAPPVEQDEHVYGEQPKRKRPGGQVSQQPESGGPMPTRRVSDGHVGG